MVCTSTGWEKTYVPLAPVISIPGSPSGLGIAGDNGAKVLGSHCCCRGRAGWGSTFVSK